MTLAWARTLTVDCADAWRAIRRSWRYPVFAIVILTFGMTLVATAFAVFNRALVAPLPYPDADRLVVLNGADSTGKVIHSVSADDWVNWAQAPVVQSSGLISFPRRAAITARGATTRSTVADVSPTFFATLRPPLRAGHWPAEEDARAGRAVAVVSEAFWNRAAAPLQSLPLTIVTDGKPWDVVGVMRRGGEFFTDVDVWFLRTPPIHGGGMARNYISNVAVVRLKPGITAPVATRYFDQISTAIRQRDRSGWYDFAATLTPLRTAILGDMRGYVRLVMAAVACVFLILCTNLAMMTAGRGIERQREFATRVALGASRARLVRQSLAEHLIIGAVAAVAATGLSYLALTIIRRHLAAESALLGTVRVDGTAIGFLVLVVGSVALAVGCVPIVFNSTLFSANDLRPGRFHEMPRGTSGSGVIAVEVALAVVLLASAGLLVHSLERLTRRNLGFDRNVVTAEFDLTAINDSGTRAEDWNRLSQAYRSIPGVRAVGIANVAPLSDAGVGYVDIKGRPPNAAKAIYRVADAGYLDVLGIRLISGRGFTADDRSGTARVGLISESMARAYWPNSSPLGDEIRAVTMESQTAAPITIVGVVSDIRQRGFEKPIFAEMYVPYAQAPGWNGEMTVVTATSGPAERLIPALRARSEAIVPTVPGDFTTLRATLADELAPRRALMTLVGVFAMLSVLFTTLGIYGVLSFTVARRRRGLAIRSALGGSGFSLVRPVVSVTARAMLIGVLLGCIGAIGGARLLRSLLVEVGPLDPVAYIGTVAIVLGIAMLAMLQPVMKALSSDPAEALKGP